jgi:transposase
LKPAREAGRVAEPLSTDLRERVVAAVNGGMSRRQAAAHFRVGVSSAIRWVAQANATGDVRPKLMGGDRRSAAIEAQAETIFSLLAEQPDATLAEYQEAMAKTGHRFSVSTIWRFFDRRELTLKKRPRTPPSRSAPTS